MPTGKNFPAGQISSTIKVPAVGVVAITVMFGAVRFWALYTCWIKAAISPVSCIKSVKATAAASGAGVAVPELPPEVTDPTGVKTVTVKVIPLDRRLPVP